MPSSASIIPYGIRKDAVKIKLKTLRVKYNVFSVTFHFGGPAFFSSFLFLIALFYFYLFIFFIISPLISIMIMAMRRRGNVPFLGWKANGNSRDYCSRLPLDLLFEIVLLLKAI